MQVVETFGKYVTKLTDEDPRKGQWLLRTGWAAQNFKFRHIPEKRLTKPDQYLADQMMRQMRYPLEKPEESAIVSIFAPCEMLHAVGIHPYNAEAFSCYLNGSKAERACLQQTDNDGLSETLCSYHRTFIGAAERGLMPKPRFIVYTNLTCDANMVTFNRLKEFYHVPAFYIDVPLFDKEEDIQYVMKQLRDLKDFLEKNTGRKLTDDALRETLRKSKQTLENFTEFQTLRADRYIPSDLVTPLYSGMANNVFLGTDWNLRYSEMLLDEVKKAPKTSGIPLDEVKSASKFSEVVTEHAKDDAKTACSSESSIEHAKNGSGNSCIRLYWMHTIPFWSQAVKKLCAFNEHVVIVGDELQETIRPDFDPEEPYRALAIRMIHHALNGSILRRIDRGIENAKRAGADGVVWFNHWGCKHTIGGAQLAKRKFEEAGLPTLILDGDGCDPTHGGEGQTETRLGAFLEMLSQEKSS